jgi:hypothetical protein
MIKSLPFARFHADIIELNEAYEGQRQILQAYDNMRGFDVETIMHVPTGSPLAVITGAVIFQGTYEVSALIGANARKYPIQFFRHVKGRIEHFEELHNLRRTQTLIRKGYPFLIKWIELLGFEQEGLLRKFGPEGDDYYMYARVK